MFVLYIDALTKKIIGYNKVVYDKLVDNISTFILPDEMLSKIDGFIGDSIYYINGEILRNECNEDIDFFENLNKLGCDISELEKKIKNEDKIFMDNILCGMSVEEASGLSKKNRDLYQESLEKHKTLLNERVEKTHYKVSEILSEKENHTIFKYFLSMVAVVRDENDYLGEWIHYHIEEIGYEHFYIYDNESKIPVNEYLNSINFKYTDKVTVIPWKTTEWIQNDAYNDFLTRFGTETKWFSAMDPDEYVFIKDKSKTLKEFLVENSIYSSITCAWKHFNANGQKHKTPGTDMERFTQEVEWNRMKGGKKIARSANVCGFTSYIPTISEKYPYLELDIDNKISKDFFQLNHYYTRSYDEFVSKIKRGSSNPNFRRKYSEFFELNPDMKYLDTGEIYEQGYGIPSNNKHD